MLWGGRATVPRNLQGLQTFSFKQTTSLDVSDLFIFLPLDKKKSRRLTTFSLSLQSSLEINITAKVELQDIKEGLEGPEDGDVEAGNCYGPP